MIGDLRSLRQAGAAGRTPIAGRRPHRSLRAELLHTSPTILRFCVNPFVGDFLSAGFDGRRRFPGE
jgi:hypothetical protein